jgi:predicted  nucleic acid-binding Zn-ribbon protein
MAGGKHKNRSNRSQGYLASSETNSPIIASPGYTITPEKQDMDLKSFLMMVMEDFRKEINNSLKEIQENTSSQVKELNKTIQDLKIEVEAIKKSQRESTLEIENLGKKSGAIDASITNRIQKIDKKILGAEDTIENIDTTIKENVKCK